MPIIGQTNEDRQKTLAMKDIAERLSELVEAKTGKCEWIFVIHRDNEGFIATVTAKPKD